MNIFEKVFPFVGRTSIYIFGFLATLLISRFLGSELFGSYSLLQSFSEFGVILLSFGAGSYVLRKVASEGSWQLPVPGIISVFLMGLPFFMAFALVFFVFIWDSRPIDYLMFSGIFIIASSLCSVVAGYSRAIGRTLVLNFDQAIRSLIIIISLFVLYIFNIEVTLPAVLFLSIVGCFLVLILMVNEVGLSSFSRSWQIPRDISDYFGNYLNAVSSFLLRKSDLLVFGIFTSSSYIGSFKLAFLVAEAPSQFVQAFLIAKTKSLVAIYKENNQEYFPYLCISIIVGAILHAGLLGFVVIFGSWFGFGRISLEIYYAILPYFILRNYLIYQENLMALLYDLRLIRLRLFGEIFCRIAGFIIVIYFFPDNPHFLYLMLLLGEFVVFEAVGYFYDKKIPFLIFIKSVKRGFWNEHEI